jgi:teichoic acid transport system permease protein
VPWFFFTEAVSGAANSLFEYSYLVKKIVFKVELLPLVKIVAASFVHFVFLALVIVLMATFAVTPTLAAVQIAYYFAATMVLVIAVSTMTVALTPFFRDLTQMVSIALQFGMWMTPIMWDDSRLPEHYRWIVFINPMTYIVEGYRDAIIRGRWFWEKPMETVYFWMFVSVLFLVGGRLFTRLRPHFADVL